MNRIQPEYLNNTIEKDFKSFILEGNHPCMMARSVFKMERYDIQVYDEMKSDASAHAILQDLQTFLENTNLNSTEYRSFAAIFPDNHFEDEITFEKSLWQTLQNLHHHDPKPWDSTVSRDPEDADFSFSLLGKAFYIIGLHPKSSRKARQAPYTTLVFNLHCQFEKLREIGKYEKIRDLVRKNDEKLQGSINPVLRDFGEDSETRQYSGRHVESNWKCPFHHK